MKTRGKSKQSTSKSKIIKNLVGNERKHVKVSKISVQSKKKFDIARTQLRKLTEESSSILQEDLKEVSLSHILKAIDELSSEPDNTTKKIIQCSMRMSLNSDIFWNSPTAILRAVKYSILSRNWDNVTHLLLLLLQHKDQYTKFVQYVCAFMAKFNPLVKKLGLLEQFEILNIKSRGGY